MINHIFYFFFLFIKKDGVQGKYTNPGITYLKLIHRLLVSLLSDKFWLPWPRRPQVARWFRLSRCGLLRQRPGRVPPDLVPGPGDMEPPGPRVPQHHMARLGRVRALGARNTLRGRKVSCYRIIIPYVPQNELQIPLLLCRQWWGWKTLHWRGSCQLTLGTLWWHRRPHCSAKLELCRVLHRSLLLQRPQNIQTLPSLERRYDGIE